MADPTQSSPTTAGTREQQSAPAEVDTGAIAQALEALGSGDTAQNLLAALSALKKLDGAGLVDLSTLPAAAELPALAQSTACLVHLRGDPAPEPEAKVRLLEDLKDIGHAAPEIAQAVKDELTRPENPPEVIAAAARAYGAVHPSPGTAAADLLECLETTDDLTSDAALLSTLVELGPKVKDDKPSCESVVSSLCKYEQAGHIAAVGLAMEAITALGGSIKTKAGSTALAQIIIDPHDRYEQDDGLQAKAKRLLENHTDSSSQSDATNFTRNYVREKGGTGAGQSVVRAFDLYEDLEGWTSCYG